MSQFAIFAALLGVVAVALVISPLWKSSRPLALALAIGLPLAAAALYHLKGEPAAIDSHAVATAATPAPTPAAMSMSMEEAVAKLERTRCFRTRKPGRAGPAGTLLHGAWKSTTSPATPTPRP